MGTLDPQARPPVVDGKVWRYVARVVRWTDGDTVVVDCLIDIGFEEMTTRRATLRLLGVNTPEKNDRDPEQRRKASEAWQFCQSTWPASSLLNVAIVGYDKYGGRHDARVWDLGEASIADVLIRRGLGVPYDGGAR